MPFNLDKIYNFVIYEHSSVKIDVRGLSILIGVLILAKLLNTLLHRALIRRMKNANNLDHARAESFIQITTYITYFFAVMLGLQAMGLNITLLLAGSTALFIGIGLGLQKTFQDFFSGLVLLVEGTLHVDDVIEYEGRIAKVRKIGIRTSVVETRSGISIIVPNSDFVTKTVYNAAYNRQPSMYPISVTVAYNSNVELVKSCLIDSANAHPKVLQAPAAYVRLVDFADSGLRFELMFFTTSFFEIENVKSGIRYDIHEKFTENNIEIPYPQRVMYLVNPEDKK